MHCCVRVGDPEITKREQKAGSNFFYLGGVSNFQDSFAVKESEGELGVHQAG